MDINKANRKDLKSYFITNARPTEKNFADLIDGMINQKDDGIVKLPGNPLSIIAEGGTNGPQKVINFYGDPADPNPAWTLQLNPHSDPNNPENATQAGFSISDGQGTSRLFIDKATGNVGIGTIKPQAKLDINGGAFLGYATTISDFNAPLKSGFYEGSGTITGDVPDGAHNWTHLLVARHSNVNANHQMQIATTFSSNDRLFFRKTASGLENPVWNEVATRGSNTFSGRQTITGEVSISNGSAYAVPKGRMASGSLSIGSTNASYGGGKDWNANTAGLLLETAENTEIAVHDSENRLASLLFYEGGKDTNRITIGRDMGWGPISEVRVNGKLTSPMWNFKQVFNNHYGPLPLESSPFSTGGGGLLIIVSGSGYCEDVNADVGMIIKVDGNKIGEARAYTNEAYSHKVFSCNPLVTNEVAAGSHIITLEALTTTKNKKTYLTKTDGNDRFNITVLEFPFPAKLNIIFKPI